MKYLISFESNHFDLESEEENPINPIQGKSVGEWLAAQLKNAGAVVSEIEPEDWGWYVDATLDGEKYLIGFSATPGESVTDKPEVVIQLEKSGSFFDSLFGRKKLAEGDPLLALIEQCVRQVPDITKLEVSNNA